MRGIRVAAIFCTLGILLPIIFSDQTWAYFFGIFIAIACMLVVLNIYQFYSNKHPQIMISAAGIQTSKIPFAQWKDIQGEDVIQISEGKTTGYYLIYNLPSGQAKHPLYFLDTDYASLRAILKMYRQ